MIFDFHVQEKISDGVLKSNLIEVALVIKP